MKEAYCSYEISKLLKEKGFNESIHTWYNTDNSSPEFIEGYVKLSNADFVANDEDSYSAPTLQMAMKWLREIYGIDIVIEISDPLVKDRKYYCMIWDGNNNSYILDLFNSYEEVVEAALKYVLENLIK